MTAQRRGLEGEVVKKNAHKLNHLVVPAKKGGNERTMLDISTGLQGTCRQ